MVSYCSCPTAEDLDLFLIAPICRCGSPARRAFVTMTNCSFRNHTIKGVRATRDSSDSTAESTAGVSINRDSDHSDSGVSGGMTSTKRAMTRCLVAHSCADSRVGNVPNQVG